MTIDDLKAKLPDYAKDQRLNLGNVFNSSGLNTAQVWGVALASSLATRNADVIRAIAAEAEGKLDPAYMNAAKAAASIMAMNNIYYRYAHLSPNGKELLKMPARMRMNVIGNPGIDKADFELFSLAVSAINGCGMCIEAHEHEVLGKGMTKEMVQDAVRIASVLHAVAATLDGEAALNG